MRSPALRRVVVMESKGSSVDGSGRLRVGVIGDSFVDVMCTGLTDLPSWSKDVHGLLTMSSGSSSGNTAINFARLGADTTYVTSLGDDEFGAFFTRRMTAEGVRCLPMLSKTDPTPVCVVVSGAQAGQRCFINSLGTNKTVTGADFLSRERELDKAQLVHLGGYFNCPRLASDELLTLVRHLTARGCRVSVDPQTDSLLGTWRGAGDNLLALLRLVDVFLPSDSEALAITRTRSTRDAIRVLGGLMRSDALLVVKCGDQGAVAARGGRVLCALPALDVRVVDTTGAGDAFNAAFLFALQRPGASVDEAVSLGNAAGGHRCTVVGASDHAPSYKQLLEFRSKHKSKEAPALKSKL